MKHRLFRRFRAAPQPFRILVVLVLGGLMLVAGLIMIVTPGPAIVFIPLGLAILSLEFMWARRLKKRALHLLRDGARRAGLSSGLRVKMKQGKRSGAPGGS